MSKKGIIFDLDGTMWDASHSNAPAWNVELARHKEIEKRITVEDIQSYMGKTMEEIAPIALPDMDIKKSLPIIKKCGKEEIKALREHGGILYPKLEETLIKLKEKYHLYIVSNCEDGYVQAFLDYHKMNEHFEDIEMAGRTGKSKAENILLIMERNSLKEAIYVGDTDGDYNSAKTAGIPFVLAEYGFGKVEDAKYKISSFEKLIELVDGIFGQEFIK